MLPSGGDSVADVSNEFVERGRLRLRTPVLTDLEWFHEIYADRPLDADTITAALH
ncbi:hypothetical protein B0O41_3031 [Propionibacteriaceae bacterium ES.041]|nr:hypothetical protein B0O41_3031 [Propionibacteriaceae bacterium ES.041]